MPSSQPFRPAASVTVNPASVRLGSVGIHVAIDRALNLIGLQERVAEHAAALTAEAQAAAERGQVIPQKPARRRSARG